MIIFKGKDNSVAIMTLAPGADREDAIKKFKKCHQGFYEEHPNEVDIPSDRKFRDAWKLANGRIIVDDKKAKEIHLNRIRIVRNKELDKLDKEHLRHLSNPEKVKEIEDKKQVLRDLPKNVKSLEWPDELPGE